MPAANYVTRSKVKPFREYPDFPPDVHAKLKQRAERNYRSIRAEIVAIVKEVTEQEAEQQRQTWPPVVEHK